MPKILRKYLLTIINSYSETVFLSGFVPGTVLLLCTFINPNVGLSGLICVFSAYLFGAFMGMKREFLKTGFYTYNPLLVGLSLGYLFQINLLTVFYLVTAGILTLVLTLALSSMLFRGFKLPPLSVPFVMVSSLCYLAARSYSNLYVTGLYPRSTTPFLEDVLPTWIVGLTKCVGAIFFTPEVLPGLVFLLLLLFVSRILFFLAVSGYLLGTMITAAMTGSFVQAFSDIYAFNFVLISLALGGVFLVPSPKSYITAAVAVAVSPFLMESSKIFWSEYGIPVFTLPFNVVTLSFLYFLRLVEFPYLTVYFLRTPEKTMDHYLSYTARYPGTFQGVSLPFSGEWKVWQGVDGRWTHKGIWRHAFDFVIVDETGDTFNGEGAKLADYYAFKKPVLSPVSGRVLCAVNHVHDNQPGENNRENNWGNAVIIHDNRGFNVVVAHLAMNSVNCSEGEWVEKGQVLGLCGNSGYSPQPHLHIHLQVESSLGAATIPLSFVHYKKRDDSNGYEYQANRIPEEGDRLIGLFPDSSIDRSTTFLLDDEMSFLVESNGKTVKETLRVAMAPSGLFYFQCGKSRLYFDKKDGAFYLTQLEFGASLSLKALFLAMPRIPLTYDDEFTWRDFLPVETAMSGLKKNMSLFMNSFNHNFLTIEGRYSFACKDEITGEIVSSTDKQRIFTSLKLHPAKGFESLKVKGGNMNISLKRIEG